MEERLQGRQVIRPLTIREDGWDGVPNIFKRWFGRSLDMCLEFQFLPPIIIPPGETAQFVVRSKEKS